MNGCWARRRRSPPLADPLTDALLFLAAYHGRALSRTALLTGLPITDGKLSVHLFERAAQRAGLEVQAVKRTIAEIPALVLPAVLVLRDGTTRILLEHSQDPRLAKVVKPPAAASAQPQPLGDDATQYLGYAFLARPASAADARTVAAGDLPKVHWFWSTVQRFWPNYTHVAIAAFIVNVLALAVAAVHHERLRPCNPQRRNCLPRRSLDWTFACHRFRFRIAHRPQSHHRHDRQKTGCRPIRTNLRTCAVGQNGAAADISRHSCQSASRLRLGARVFHLRQRGVSDRSVVRGPVCCCALPNCRAAGVDSSAHAPDHDRTGFAATASARSRHEEATG